ncbi:hypothetical protein H0H87_007472 [Tephrocybe sp. NHM501043]|nr:hypothetical protein H0H87_007472 [Tephrocybe sp. NHM501043]
MSAPTTTAYDPTPPPPRSLSSSIWAPQPQPSETTWPKALDSFQREAMWNSDHHHQQHGHQHTQNPHFQPHEQNQQNEKQQQSVVRREDVFGPVLQEQQQRAQGAQVRAPGAIGDGRKKSPGDSHSQLAQVPFVDADSHVEQLLRTLNLNSPAPVAPSNANPNLNTKKAPPPALSLDLSSSSSTTASPNYVSGLAAAIDSPSSPDFSPASATSSLMTPTDLSPSSHPHPHAHGPKSPYDYGFGLGLGVSGAPYLQHPGSLLFEHPSPAGRTQAFESYISSAQQQLGNPYPHTNGHAYEDARGGAGGYQPTGFPFFESFEGMHAYQNQQRPQTPPQTQPASSHVQPPMTQQQQSLSHPALSLQPRTLYNPSTAVNAPSAASTHNATNASTLNVNTITAPTSPTRARVPPMDWRLQPQPQQAQPQLHSISDWHFTPAPASAPTPVPVSVEDVYGFASASRPINFLSLLHPSSSPPYALFVERIIKASDQQASIFLQQKLKVADGEERGRIVDAICARGFEMMAHRFGNWAVQRCLEAAAGPEERRKMVACMRGRVVELATNCYGCHVLQKALDCEEDIRLLIVSELLLGDPAQTLVNKHASHVWSKIMELSWTPPAPPIFAYVNKSLKGKWASLACHETGSLVVQHAFENLEAEAKDGIVDELINSGPQVFAEVAKNQWGSYCVQHILEHGSDEHRAQTLQHLLDGLLDFATSEQGAKSVTKALKEGGKQTLDRIVERMCEAASG